MVAIQYGTIHDVATKVGTITKLGCTPAPALSRNWTWCNWVNRCPQEISEAKGQHLCMGNFRLPSLLAYIQQQLRVPDLFLYRKLLRIMALRVQLVIFGERFRGGQYLLVSFLFAPRCPTCPAICKSGGTPACPVVPDPCLGHGPSVMVWGQGIWETEVPQFGPVAKP